MPVEPKLRNDPSELTGTKLAILAAIAAAIAILIIESSRRPYLPGDLLLARTLQSLGIVPIPVGKLLDTIANLPWSLVLVGLTALAAWKISGWPAALLTFPIFFGLLLFGLWLSPHVAQPRPSPDLVTVTGHPKGFSFPSISALEYASTFGYLGLLAAVRLHGAPAIVIPTLAAAMLILVACARITLGAHWPSDLLASYLMSFLWIELLLPLARHDALAREA